MFKQSTFYIILICCSSSFGNTNILVIVSDDLRTALGCYGDKSAVTPNIDDLSKKCVIFNKAYAQQALCAPSRNSFLTSRRPDTLKLYDFYSYWRTSAGNFTTLPQHFKQNGYFTKSIGKVFHPGISSNFSDDQPYSWSCTPYHPSTEAYMNDAVCGQPGRGLKRNLVCPVHLSTQPEGTLPDLQSLREARSFLRNATANPDQLQPFFLAVGFHKPHVPLKYPWKYLAHHPLKNVSLPPAAWTPPDLPTVAWNHWEDVRSRDDISALNISFPFGHMPDKWSKLIRQSYYAAVTYIDDLVGKLIREMKSTKLYDNTIIVLLGDHGWSLGEHGEWAKFSNFESAVRVPLLVRVPGLTDKYDSERRIEDPVELVDLFPTLVEAAQLRSMPSCPDNSSSVQLCTDGNSLMPLIYSAMKENKTSGVASNSVAMSQYPRPGTYPSLHPNSDKPLLQDIRYMGYSIRTSQYRYTEWPAWTSTDRRPDWTTLAGAELYDHSIDPQEGINLAHRPQFHKIRLQLSTLLRRKVNRSVNTVVSS